MSPEFSYGYNQEETKKARNAALDETGGYGKYSHCVHHGLSPLDAVGENHPDFGKGWDAKPAEVGAWVDCLNDPEY